MTITGGDDDDFDWDAHFEGHLAAADDAKAEEVQKAVNEALPDTIKKHESIRGHVSGDPLRLKRLEDDRLLGEAVDRIDPTNTMLRKVVAQQLIVADPVTFKSPQLERLIARVRPRRK
jgi:hypothetical protein